MAIKVNQYKTFSVKFLRRKQIKRESFCFKLWTEVGQHGESGARAVRLAPAGPEVEVELAQVRLRPTEERNVRGRIKYPKLAESSRVHVI